MVNIHSGVVMSSQVGVHPSICLCTFQIQHIKVQKVSLHLYNYSVCLCVLVTYGLQEHRCLDVVVVEHTQLCTAVDNTWATEERPKIRWRNGVQQL